MLLNIRDTMQKLRSYENSPFPILSVYLNITDSKNIADIFTNLITKSFPDHKKVLIDEDIRYITSFLSVLKNKHKYKGIALYSGGNRLWEVITTMFPLKESVTLSYSPNLSPLSQELDAYNRYLIILADREKTRLYTLYLGTIEDKEEFNDADVPQKVKANGSSELEKRIDRHIKDHLHKHFDAVAKRARAFIQRKPLAGVVIGGHKTSMHVLENHLPKVLQKKIIGEFIADTDLDINSVVQKSKEIIQKQAQQST